jgi:multisubunit Na+/H+ antiporter MnhE subunit
MNALLLNLALALLWLLLRPVPTHTHVAIGFLLGFALIAAFRRLLGAEDYVRRSVGLFRFVFRFLSAFFRACASIFFLILFRPRRAMRPGFLNYDVTGLTRTEVLILAQSISLTPGTTTVEISEDFTTLELHAMDAADPDAVRRDIDTNLRAPLLEVTR